MAQGETGASPAWRDPAAGAKIRLSPVTRLDPESSDQIDGMPAAAAEGVRPEQGPQARLSRGGSPWCTNPGIEGENGAQLGTLLESESEAPPGL